nr:MAG TPA: hypothetical protein [Caudoviricetes sp.]
MLYRIMKFVHYLILHSILWTNLLYYFRVNRGLSQLERILQKFQ